MNRRTNAFIMAILATSASYADSGVTGLDDAAGGISSYLPYVQGLCLAMAAVIAVAGIISIYLAMQTEQHPQVKKRILMSAGSCICFVTLAFSLPNFFGLDSSGVGDATAYSGNAEANTESSGGFLSSDEGGISKSGIITTIPDMNDLNSAWIHFPNGTNMTAANHVMDIFYHMGAGGAPGAYGRTLDYINTMYENGTYDETTYHVLINVAGSLPHD